MKEIDARGLACPAPVLQTKAALQEERPAGVRIVVDNAASQQNVQRFLESQGFQTKLEQNGADYLVIGSCASTPEEQFRSVAAQPGAGAGGCLKLRDEELHRAKHKLIFSLRSRV